MIGFIKGSLSINMYYWGHTYLTLGYALVLLWALLNTEQTTTQVLRNRFLRECGRYSYTLYLFHPLFISLFFTLAHREREIIHSVSDAVLAIAALAASVAFSVGFYWMVERRAVAIGKKYNYHLQPSVTNKIKAP